MIGEKMTFEELPQDGVLTVGKKKMNWYEHYKWDSMEQYEEWRKWARNEMKILGEKASESALNYADFRYGFTVRYKKEGELF